MMIYAAIGAVGLLFLLVMLFVGELFGGDHDLHAGDIGGHDAGGEANAGPGWFSSRVMASFLTAFGVGGVVARYNGLSHPIASGVGVAAGVIMASIVYNFAKLLYSQQASSEVRITSLVGMVAEVAVAIPERGLGQITVSAAAERSTHIARTKDGRALPAGVTVRITGIGGEGFIVEPVARDLVGGTP